MDVLSLMATLGINTSAYEQGLEGAEKTANSFGASLRKGLGVAAGVTTAAIGAVTVATVAGTKAFINGVSSVAEYGDTIDKMSQKMNMSIEGYQEWDFVMQHCGTTIESMQASIKTLSNAAENNNDAFERLGMTQEEIASMSGEELFNATITALQGVEDETERTYLAGQLLGRGATELGALLNMTAEDTAAMKEQVHELGGVLSDDAVKSAAGFQDSLQNMQVAFSGVKNSLLTEFLPSFSTVMDGLATIFSGDSETGLGMIEEGVNDLVDKVTEVLPRFIEIGGKILTSLASAITKNLPTLLQSGKGVLNELIQGIISNLPAIVRSAATLIGMIGSAIIDNLPLILNTGIELLMMLMQGITENAPTVIPAIVSVVTDMISYLTSPENYELFITAGLQLIIALAEGLVQAIPDLVAIIPEIIANIIVTITDMFPEIIEACLTLIGQLGVAVLGALLGLLGASYQDVVNSLNNIKEFINNSFEAIKSFFSNLGETIKEKVSSMWDSIVSFFSDGLQTAKETVENVLNNIHDKFDEIFENVKNVVKNAIDFIKGLFDFEWSLPDLKLPHFTVTGSLDLMTTPPSIPKLSVDWYKKGYSDAYILNGATIFGAQGGSLLGGGEGTGGEVIVGTSKLVSMMSEAVREAGIGETTIICPVYIGDEKIDEVIIKANRRNDYISGGR